jgi:uncharacterized protein (UPF0261 family)
MGINEFTKKIVDNAASAIVSMCMVDNTIDKISRPLCAITSYGSTTKTVISCMNNMKKIGWDSLVFHQTGNGEIMEDLIRAGNIKSVFDITLGELPNTYFKSPFGVSDEWKGERLTAASEMGIPQIVCLGGLDACAYGPLRTVPKRILDEYKEGKRINNAGQQRPYMHNDNVSVITLTIEETKIFANYIIEKLNKTRGPTVLAVPMQGFSAYDQSNKKANISRGWPKEKGAGPNWWPDQEKPEWSFRAVTMWNVFEEKIDKNNKNLDILQCDNNLIDEDFSKFLYQVMKDIIEGNWEKGMYRNLNNVVK